MTRPLEAERDQAESAFTPILRKLWDGLPLALAAVFVDREGETIDYVSALDPYDAKVSAAHAQVLMDEVRTQRAKLGLAEPILLVVWAEMRELWIRRVSEEYLLVLSVLPGADPVLARGLMSVAGREFRSEVSADTPSWEPAEAGMQVEMRAAVGWAYAPSAFIRQGARIGVEDVLGRWTEPPDEEGEVLVCFRVRTVGGEELTLVHGPGAEDWQERV